jgi:hypothetical protein
LNAGALSAELDGIDLRYIRIGDTELVRRVHAAVRGVGWSTVPAEVTSREADVTEDGFSVRFSARHLSDEIDFSWDGSLVGAADGITCTLDGVAGRDIVFNRIGYCVLHPPRPASYRALSPEGEVRGELPELIAPQRFGEGRYYPMFPSFSELELEYRDGARVRFVLEGDLWETEDQRNWTDASFKTYGTPLALGFPHRLPAGARVRQTVTIAVDAPARPRRRSVQPVQALVGEPLHSMPAIGVTAGAGAHVRADLRLGEDWRGALGQGRSWGAPLEIALHVDPSDPDAVDEVRAELLDAAVERILVFVRDAVTATPDETTPGTLVADVRDRLSLGVPVCGGSDLGFCELNRARPAAGPLDGIAFPILATAHAVDDISVMETTSVHGETVATLRTFASGLPIHVTPISIGPRASVDPREHDAFGAAWTAASIAVLARAGAASLTYRVGGAALGVLEAACALGGAAVLDVTVDRPLELAVLATDLGLIAANLMPERRFAQVGDHRLELAPYETARLDRC